MKYSRLRHIHDYQGKNILIQYKYGVFPVAEIIQYCDQEKTLCSCIEGCSNYSKNRSCPPYSPSFISYSSKFTHLQLIVGYLSLEQFDNFAEKERLRVGYGLLKTLMGEKISSLEEALFGTMIPGGCCELCKSCPLTGCTMPDKLRYNFTSLGMLMEDLSIGLFEHQLLWSSDQKSPAYTSCFGGVLTNEEKMATLAF